MSEEMTNDQCPLSKGAAEPVAEGVAGPRDGMELLRELLAAQLAEILALRAEVAELKRRLGER